MTALSYHTSIARATQSITDPLGPRRRGQDQMGAASG
jgi:hypothetical protein